MIEHFDFAVAHYGAVQEIIEMAAGAHPIFEHRGLELDHFSGCENLLAEDAILSCPTAAARPINWKAANLPGDFGSDDEVSRSDIFHGLLLPGFDGPVGVDEFDFAEDRDEVGIGFQSAHGRFEKAGSVAIVGIEKRDVFSARDAEAGVASGGGSLISLRNQHNLVGIFDHQRLCTLV